LSWLLYFITSLLTACAVSIAGCIGFVGLIVPHMLRQFGNNDHRFILPGSVLLGGILLTLADTLSRSLMAPIQLPVGVVTAIIGVPCFLFLLRRGSKK
jgi:iron complex transport system permease protein